MPWFWIIAAVFLIAFGAVAFIGAPYVPSRKKYINQAFTELYNLSDRDLLVDVGSGDGIVLRQASKLGARAIGLEINPFLVAISGFLSRRDPRVTSKLANYWLSHLPDDTTVVYVFSVTRDIEKIANWVQSESNRLHKKINLISFGSGPSSISAIKSLGAYNLYQFCPLHTQKAQV